MLIKVGVSNQIDELQKKIKNGEPGIDQSDINALKRVLFDLVAQDIHYEKAYALAIANTISKSVQIHTKIAAAAQSSGTFGFSVGLDVDISATKDNSISTTQVTKKSAILGANVNIKTDSDGKVLIKGSDINAGDIDINTGDLAIEATKTQNTTARKSNTSSVNVGITIDDPSKIAKAFDAPNMSLNTDSSKSSSNSIQHDSSTITGNNIKITTAKDTTIKGGKVMASDKLTIKTGGTLLVGSVKDTNKSSSAEEGFSISASFKDTNKSSSADGGLSTSGSIRTEIRKASYGDNPTINPNRW